MKSTFALTEGRGQLVESLPFSEPEYERRLAGLRDLMKLEGVDYFISFTPENIYYVTGHDTPGYYFYQACIVSHDQKPVNILRRIESTNTLWKSWNRQVVVYEDRQDPVAATLWMLDELGLKGKKVGLEADAFFVTPRRYAQLVKGIGERGGSHLEIHFIEQLRVVKSEEELRYIREAAKVVGESMRAAIAASAVGHTEDHVAAHMLSRMAMCGGEYAGLPPFVTSGPRSSLCHATWGGRTLRFGDVLAYELPGVRNRYVAALFRCGTVGKAPSDVKRLADACIGSLDASIGAIKPGVLSQDVNAAARRNFEKAGYGHLHGHRIGYSLGVNYPPDWGEGQIMSLWAEDERPLKEGMVFHLVPGIFIPGRYLINISDTVLVTKDGCEILTDFPRELFEVSVS